MLKSCTYKQNPVEFYLDNIDKNKNIFSVIVGVNGIGKSRLLSSIATNAADLKEISPQLRADGIPKLSKELNTKYLIKPKTVITTSISPFDKFPISENTNSEYTSYKYLGIRNIQGHDIGFFHTSRIIGNLLQKITKNNLSPSILSNILHYLGYDSKVTFEFSVDRYRLEYRSTSGITENELKK